jgi:hypothetical protein
VNEKPAIAAAVALGITAAAAAGQGYSPRAQVVAELRRQHLLMQPNGPFKYEFFAPVARAYWNPRGEVVIWEFRTRARAAAAADRIAPDGNTGNTIGGHHVLWKGVPHWFRRGRVIALYLGGDSPVRRALTRVLGRQIAGS